MLASMRTVQEYNYLNSPIHVHRPKCERLPRYLPPGYHLNSSSPRDRPSRPPLGETPHWPGEQSACNSRPIFTRAPVPKVMTDTNGPPLPSRPRKGDLGVTPEPEKQYLPRPPPQSATGAITNSQTCLGTWTLRGVGRAQLKTTTDRQSKLKVASDDPKTTTENDLQQLTVTNWPRGLLIRGLPGPGELAPTVNETVTVKTVITKQVTTVRPMTVLVVTTNFKPSPS